MARYMEPTAEQVAGYAAWLAECPSNVRTVAERFEPWSLYRLRSSGHRVIPMSFDEAEDGTVTLTVRVSAQYNQVMFERDVFGITPDDLEPCGLLSADEPIGAAMTSEEVDANIDAMRLMARPDLWALDPVSGKVIRRQ